MVNLTDLSLNNNCISDLSPLPGLKKLRSLVLNNNSVGSISLLSDLTELRILNLENNSMMDLDGIQNLTNLQTLRLVCNQITDITSLVNNQGLGSGDTIRLANNYLDLDFGPAMQNIQALIDRGANVEYSPQNPI